jgi:cellulose synthase/poly-beta-1,6-N-acetylglucosamine synthase-like glycosyltransferase/glycosyltransferase involved in cell wall biosynthesis/O-antigen/teichoic acid export membrane protein
MYQDGLSIIIPTYNEAESIRQLVLRIHTAMTAAHEAYEIIVVDDHSKDRTVPILKRLTKTYPIRIHPKIGKPGKGYSILEGSDMAMYRYIAMIDADLQYPPELLPELLAKAREQGCAVAVRRTYQSTPMRRFVSRANAFIFGKLLLGIPTDVQSGLKIFHHEVFDHINRHLVGPWSIDMPLLFTAYELGHHAGEVPFDFRPRTQGASRVSLIPTSLEVALGAIRTRFSQRTHVVKPESTSMVGAGVAHRRKRYITHSTLPLHRSALTPLSFWQQFGILLLLGLVVAGLMANTLPTAIALVGVLSTVYFIDVLFNLFLVLKSLYNPPELMFDQHKLDTLDEAVLPVYTIMCPLYREAAVLPHFLASVDGMSWPKDKLDVIILLEEDDTETKSAVAMLKLPEYIRVIIVPHSQPKTKPKACNFGLEFAKGEFVVVYDAEDEPDAMQLKKSYLAFLQQPKNVACMQAKLNYYNPNDNLLTRLFTAEYSLWFDVVLTGLQSINTTIPLGGTSNHFRTEVLRSLHGWDSFNVTEDCDLGARLFQMGYRTSIIDSTTLEEANSDVKNWLRQRSRWIKGYIQTYFVHLRNPVRFIREYRGHGLIFLLLVGGRIAFMLINPFLWLATIAYFALYAIVGPTIESLYPSAIFYMAVISLVFGNFLCVYYYMIGSAKRGHWNLMKYIFLVPLYWLMVSVGATIAIFQFIVKPHYWEKTIHGLHLAKREELEVTKNTVTVTNILTAQGRRLASFVDSIGKERISGGVLIASALAGNVMSFLYNAYLGRAVSFADFGLISVIGSFVYITQIPVGAISATVTHQSAYLLGKHGAAVQEFWRSVRTRTVHIATAVVIIWLAATPLMANFLHADSYLPFYLFAPVWFVTIVNAVDNGYLNGNLQFIALGVFSILETATKLGLTIGLVSAHKTDWVYVAIPLSMLLSYVLAWWKSVRTKPAKLKQSDITKALHFPKRFFFTAALIKTSTIGFLVFDVILAKHYLSPADAGRYSLLSLIGKMVYFAGGLFSQFVMPIVSREEGAGRKSGAIFIKLLGATAFACAGAFVLLGPLGKWVTPILWGSKAYAIVPLLSAYTLGIALLCLAQTIVVYHQSRKQYIVVYATFLLSMLQILGFIMFHETIEDFVLVTAISGFVTLGIVALVHMYYSNVRSAIDNFTDFLYLFVSAPTSTTTRKPEKLRILIMNWYDVKHSWAGGAELYIHAIAKRLVAEGHQVTFFCGNDHKLSRQETVDGIKIIRHGGQFTVAFWAFIYYVVQFRNKFDIVIDVPKGVPFFTPLYSRVPIICLIHQVHQDMFRSELKFPLKQLSMFLEAKAMPFVYRKVDMVAVSQSTKEAMESIGLGKTRAIQIISPGVEVLETKARKTRHPSVVYLGRLRPYKFIDLLLIAISNAKLKIPKLTLTVAGAGEDMQRLKDIAKKLDMLGYVTFTGRVSEEAKAALFAKSWVAVQPSMVEGWGITNIEANYFGVPVVAANTDGLKDSVRDGYNGILVKPQDPDAIEQAIVHILNDSVLRKTLSRNAKQWAQNFNWDDSATQFSSLLQQLAATTRHTDGVLPVHHIPAKARFAFVRMAQFISMLI